MRVKEGVWEGLRIAPKEIEYTDTYINEIRGSTQGITEHSACVTNI